MTSVCLVDITVVDPTGRVHHATCGYPRPAVAFEWVSDTDYGVAGTDDVEITWTRGRLVDGDPRLAALRVAAALSDRRAPVLES